MKILIKQFLSKNHSWRFVGSAIANEFIANGHQVDLFSTDGSNVNKELQNNLIGYTELNSPNIIGKIPDHSYDLALSYTAMKNFQNYLQYGKRKFGIWCYEWMGKNVLPTGFAKHHLYCDKILAPSNFAKQVFLDSGVPNDKIEVIPHGISKEYLGTSKINLPTKKSFKILANIAQNHKRKNIPGLLEAYGKAFTKKDDVCLILKGKDKPVTAPFEVSIKECLNNFRSKFKNHADIIFYNEFLEDISILYRSVDAVFSMTKAEAYYMPGHEALASGKLNIVSRWGGQLDFLNDDNSILINGKEERADPTSMYWESKPNAIWFKPDINDAVEKLRYAKNNYLSINNKLEQQRLEVYNTTNWKIIVNKIENMYKCLI